MFEKGEIVWSKIKGFPWWPAVVRIFLKIMNSQVAKIIDNKEYFPSDFKNSEYLVNFIGDNSQYYYFPFAKL